ncbi:hypothetical protein KUCAC02_001486, partial [Chaenocephalus aceratus]
SYYTPNVLLVPVGITWCNPQQDDITFLYVSPTPPNFPLFAPTRNPTFRASREGGASLDIGASCGDPASGVTSPTV